MTAALTGRPLLALLLACYVAAVLLLARFCGGRAAYDTCLCGLRHDDEADEWETDEWEALK